MPETLSQIVQRHSGSVVYGLRNFVELEIPFPVADYISATITAQMAGDLRYMKEMAASLRCTTIYRKSEHVSVEFRFNNKFSLDSVLIFVPTYLSETAREELNLDALDVMIWVMFFNSQPIIHTSQSFSADVIKYFALAEDRVRELYTVHRLLHILLDAHDLRVDFKANNPHHKGKRLDHPDILDVDYRQYWLHYIRPEANFLTTRHNQIITDKIANKYLSEKAKEYIGRFLDKRAIAIGHKPMKKERILYSFVIDF